MHRSNHSPNSVALAMLISVGTWLWRRSSSQAMALYCLFMSEDKKSSRIVSGLMKRKLFWDRGCVIKSTSLDVLQLKEGWGRIYGLGPSDNPGGSGAQLKRYCPV